MNTIITVFAFLLTEAIIQSGTVTKTLAAPVSQEEGRWVKPCGGSVPVQDIGIPLPLPSITPDINRQLATLKTTAKEAEDICNTASQLMVSTVLTNSYAESELEPKPTLQGFPLPCPVYILGDQIDEMLQRAVEKASQIAVFLELALSDTHQSYTSELKHLDTKNINMLCTMHEMLKGQNKEVTSVVSRDIIPQNATGLDISKTDDRNYLIIRDARKVFISISESVDSYLNDNPL